MALFLIAAYFPGYLHGDSQVRWVWAHDIAYGQDILPESQYFHPLLTGVLVLILKSGLPVWIWHVVQIMLFYLGAVLLFLSVFRKYGILILGGFIILLPPIWNFSALQSTDTLTLIGFIWYLLGFSVLLNPRISKLVFSGSVIYITLGSVLIFCSRYNSILLAPVLVLIPLVCRLSFSRKVTAVLCGLSGLLLSMYTTSVSDLPEAYKLETIMAAEMVGFHKKALEVYPDAESEPFFWNSLDNKEVLLHEYSELDTARIIWKNNFFRPNKIDPIADQIRKEYFSYFIEFPKAVFLVKLRSSQTTLGLSAPLDGWFFKKAPDEYLEYINLKSFYYNPLLDWTYPLSVKILESFYALFSFFMRPIVWWVLYSVILGLRLVQKRIDCMDLVILALALGYYASFFIFSIGFYLRYVLPVFFLLLMGGFRLLFPQYKQSLPSVDHCARDGRKITSRGA